MAETTIQVVKRLRSQAYREARERFPWVRSRGALLCTSSKGAQVEPNPAADAPTWNGTKRQILALQRLVAERYPEVDRIYIEGGYDGADRLDDLKAGNYEPWVSQWEVTVWTPSTGWEAF